MNIPIFFSHQREHHIKLLRGCHARGLTYCNPDHAIDLEEYLEEQFVEMPAGTCMFPFVRTNRNCSALIVDRLELKDAIWDHSEDHEITKTNSVGHFLSYLRRYKAWAMEQERRNNIPREAEAIRLNAPVYAYSGVATAYANSFVTGAGNFVNYSFSEHPSPPVSG